MIELIKKLVRIGIVSISGEDNGTIPLQQVSYKGKGGNGTAWYPYGFHAVAKPDSYTLIILPNANSEERVHIPTSMLERPNGNPGDVFVFHPDTGAEIHFDSTGKITITGVADVTIVSPTKISMAAPDIELNGDVVIDGTLGGTGAVDFDSTLNVDGSSSFHDAVLVDNTTDTDGTFDVREHIHIRSGAETTGPSDTGDQ